MSFPGVIDFPGWHNRYCIFAFHPTLRDGHPTAIKHLTYPMWTPRAFCPLPLICSLLKRFQSNMYFSHSFVLAILPFLAAAIPMAQPKSRGIAIPISKRLSTPVGSSSLYASRVQSSVA